MVMKRIVGFCCLSFGGLIILYFFSSFLGLVANLFEYDLNTEILKPVIYTGFKLIGGFTMFGLGWKLVKNETGVIFISLGCLGFFVGAIDLLVDFLGSRALLTSYSIGKFTGNLFLICSGVVMVYAGVKSFSTKTNSTILDDPDNL